MSTLRYLRDTLIMPHPISPSPASGSLSFLAGPAARPTLAQQNNMSKIAIKSANELETSAKTRRAAKLPSTLLPHLNSDLVTQIQVTILDNLSATHEIDAHYDQAIEVDF